MSATAFETAFAAEDGWPVGVRKTGWLAQDFDSAAVTHHLSQKELELLLVLVDASKSQQIPVTEITRERFDHPELRPLFAKLVKTLKWGPGLLFLAGLPVNSRPLDDIWRLYWGIGTHFGIPVSQNVKGELRGQVAVDPTAKDGRVYGSSSYAPLHSDRIDQLSLLCVHKAKVGGANVFVSSLAVWDAVERERPDLFALLKRGFHQHRNGEEGAGQEPVTPYRVPVFGEVDGFRSALFSGNSFVDHQRKRFPDMLTDIEAEALTFVRQVAERPEFTYRSTLEPGEVVFINNYEILHSREAFENGDADNEKRLLLRLWLQGRPWRPKPEEMHVMCNPSGLQGIDAKTMNA